MKRETKTVYASDDGKELLTLKNGKASIECAYYALDPDTLEELATACQAAAEELRAVAYAEQAS